MFRTKKIKIILATIIFFIFPQMTFAQQVCKNDGYTISAINGVFTDEEGARDNQRALSLELGFAYLGEKIDYEYLLNPSHLGGLGDLAMSVVQKAFESETVNDYDLVEMLKDASAKVQTKKLLLVAHSQGNFYANSFYDIVAGNEGGVPAQSIGIYSVANPASRVAGGGQWLTSDTDKVIAGIVASVPFRKIMSPNTSIVLQNGDDFKGHSFSDVYLKYRSAEIVSGIRDSLDNLSSDNSRNENSPCINPPKLSVTHKIEGAVFAVADPVALGGIKVASVTVKTGVIVGTVVAKTSIGATVALYDLSKNTVVWTYNTSIVAAVWGYDTAIATGKYVGNGALTVGSIVYNAVASAMSASSFASNNGVVVILATEPTQSTPPQVPNIASVKKHIVVMTTPSVLQQANPAPVATPSQKPQAVFVFEPKIQSGGNAPKLVFVGSFSVGSSPVPQILGVKATAPMIEEVVVAADEPVLTAGVALATPAVSIPQCAQTLATDGCLIATTTVHFEWPPVPGADFYLINKNGKQATTTENTLDVEIKDFSDYVLEVVAVGADKSTSATSTQKVSVATIPIAINEIAWMGTIASATDEWFELKNNTNHIIDLSQWELNAKDGTPHVKLTGTIVPKAYLVFERTNNNPIADVDAHQTYKGALGNAGEQLNLSYASTTIDQTPDVFVSATSTWGAGENGTSTKKTMERYSSRENGATESNWGTNLGYIKNGIDSKGKQIEGTPGAQNSVSTLINKGQDITGDFTITADEERYIIHENNFWVPASTTLTIEPGVKINFYNSGGIVVEGRLMAEGTPENKIILSSFDDSNSGGITFRDTSSTSTINYATIHNTRGIEAYGATTTVNILNTDFSDNAIALELYSGAHAKIASSTIVNTFDNDAIGVYGSTLEVASTTIDGVSRGDGIAVYNGELTVAGSVIRNVSGAGISNYQAISTISSTVIENAGYAGIDIYKGSATISSTIIENARYAGIDIYKGSATISDTTITGTNRGAGVSVASSSAPVVITGGEISWNSRFGISADASSSVILTDVSIHDNGKNEEDNVVFRQ